MLPKENRLHKDNDIKDLVKRGQSFFLPEMVLKYRKQRTEQPIQIAFVVSAKVDKRAVVRNKVTRRLKEASKEMLPRLKNGYFLLIIAKKKILDLEFKDIKKQLDFAFSKAKLYND